MMQKIIVAHYLNFNSKIHQLLYQRKPLELII